VGGRPQPTIRFNGLFSGTSPPMLPNLGIAMEMNDAKEHDLVDFVDEVQTVGKATDLCHAHPHFSLLKHERIFGNSSHRSFDLK